MVNESTSFVDAGLSQPWIAWVKEKKSPQAQPLCGGGDLSVGEEKMCPGGPNCSFDSHALGTTIYCAVLATDAKKDIGNGVAEATGTSG